MLLDFIDTLTESVEGPRIPHPEDTIFTSSTDAMKCIDTLENIIQHPESITIKWDGGIALFFGISPKGEFFISDKYMYPAGFCATSPAEWERYDTTIKSSKTARTDLYPKLAALWNGLKASVTTAAVFKGDLMAIGNEMVPQNNNFVFRPVTVLYTVPVRSQLGELMQGKAALVVVHSMNQQPWDGTTGLQNNSNVAIVNPNLAPLMQGGIKFKLNEPVQLLRSAKHAVATHGTLADDFLTGLDGAMKGRIKTYFNKLITQQTPEKFDAWLQNPENKISKKQITKLVVGSTGENGNSIPPYLVSNRAGWRALVHVWNAVYALKVSMNDSLQAQVTGIGQSINGVSSGEGFVSNGIKLVNRGVFGVAHFNK